MWREIAMGVCVAIAGPAMAADSIGERLPRQGEEIMVCGQLFDVGAPVVLWTDPGGYDAYRVERRFSPPEKANWADSIAEVPELIEPNRYSARIDTLAPDEIARIRGGGWDLPLLQKVVDQFVLHYDVCGVSQTCFKVLHDARGLSVHFMLDVDGTIYQTLDLKDRARHATKSNNRSVGIEIAHIGAYGAKSLDTLDRWYKKDARGRVIFSPPTPIEQLGVRTPNFVGRPARDELIVGVIQRETLHQYDFTPEQYASLIRLTAALCTIFPQIECDYPRDADGKLIPVTLTDDQWKNFHGVLGHYHVQTNKTDPGPALDWEKVIGGAKTLMR